MTLKTALLAGTMLVGLVSLTNPVLSQTTVNQQCVASAYAGGTGDTITIPALPCALTTNLLILTTTSANATTTPTLQPLGLQAQTITRPDGTPLAIGDLEVNYKALLTPTGQKWILLNPAGLLVTFPITTGEGGTGQTTFSAGNPLLGNGIGPISQGSLSGNTTVFPTQDLTAVNGDCAQYDSFGGLIPVACAGGGGGSGTVAAGIAGQLAYYASSGTTVVGATVGSGLSLSGGTLTVNATNDFFYPIYSLQGGL